MENQPVLVNVEFGLSQLSGNSDLLERLLGRFLDEYQNANQKLSEFHQHNNHDEMRIFVHTIKGVSGNMGFEKLAVIAKTVEAQAKEHSVQDDDLDELKETLTETIEHIKQLNLKETTNQAPPEVPEPTQSVNNSLSELKSALREHRFISDEMFNEYVEQSDLSAETIESVREAIADLDYPLALSILDR